MGFNTCIYAKFNCRKDDNCMGVRQYNSFFPKKFKCKMSTAQIVNEQLFNVILTEASTFAPLSSFGSA